VAFVGPSGAGKTSALAVMHGMLLPTAGSVHLAGTELSAIGLKQMRVLRSQIGFIPQDLGLVPNLRVSQNVLAGRLGMQGFFSSMRSLVWPPRGELEAVLRILERLGIADKMFQRTDTLSGGERQRVAIARALYQGANTILADEPLSALDPARARETLELLVEVAKENSVTLILSMHALDLAREFVPRLIGLRNGEVLFDRAGDRVSSEEFDLLYQLEEAPVNRIGNGFGNEAHA